MQKYAFRYRSQTHIWMSEMQLTAAVKKRRSILCHLIADRWKVFSIQFGMSFQLSRFYSLSHCSFRIYVLHSLDASSQSAVDNNDAYLTVNWQKGWRKKSTESAAAAWSTQQIITIISCLIYARLYSLPKQCLLRLPRVIFAWSSFFRFVNFIEWPRTRFSTPSRERKRVCKRRRERARQSQKWSDNLFNDNS